MLDELAKLRKKFHLMQYDVCRYIGVSDVAYRTWELHIRKPNDEHYERLVNVFEILTACSGEINDRESALKVLERELGNE